MKKPLLVLSLIIGAYTQSKSQSIEIRRAEESFIDLFGQRLFSKLNAVTLVSNPFRKIFYYSYKVIDNDSISYFSHNDKNHLMDSIARVSFTEAIDSMKKKE